MAKRKRVLFRHYFGLWNLLGPRYFLPSKCEEIARIAAEKRLREKQNSLRAKKRPRHALLQAPEEDENHQVENILTNEQLAAREAFLRDL